MVAGIDLWVCNAENLCVTFLDALAFLDFKLSVSGSPFFTASASTGLSDYFGQIQPVFASWVNPLARIGV